MGGLVITLPKMSSLLLQTLSNLDARWPEAEMYLQNLGEDAVYILRTAIHSGSVHQRVNAIRLLERAANTSSISDLLALQIHPHPWVRMAAAKALGSIPHWSAVSGLIDWMEIERDLLVKVWIVTSLGNIGDASILPVLINELKHAEGEMMTYTVINALGALGNACTIRVLLPYTYNESSHIRKHAEEAVIRLVKRLKE